MARKVTLRQPRRASVHESLAWQILVALTPVVGFALIFAVLSQSHGGF